MAYSAMEFDEMIPIEGDLAVSGLVDIDPAFRGSFIEAPLGATASYRHCNAPFVDLRIGGRTFRFDLTFRHVVVGDKGKHMTRDCEIALLSDCLGDEIDKNCGERFIEEIEKRNLLGG